MKKPMRAILYDADFIIALLVSEESTHERARRDYQRFGDHAAFLLDAVRFEVMTVLSRKYGAAIAKLAYARTQSQHFQYLRVQEVEAQAWQEFLSHHKKNISFFDCANIVSAKKYDLKIASFDTFYPKEILAA